MPNTHRATKAQLHVKATTTVKDRTTDLLRSELFVGGFVVTRSKKIRPFYLPRAVSFTQGDAEDKRMILAQSTDDATKFRPRLYPQTITANVIVPLKDAGDIPDIWLKNVGTPSLPLTSPARQKKWRTHYPPKTAPGAS